jgi:hypothetical protein
MDASQQFQTLAGLSQFIAANSAARVFSRGLIPKVKSGSVLAAALAPILCESPY